jgi:hypothetical protein
MAHATSYGSYWQPTAHRRRDISQETSNDSVEIKMDFSDHSASWSDHSSDNNSDSAVPAEDSSDSNFDSDDLIWMNELLVDQPHDVWQFPDSELLRQQLQSLSDDDNPSREAWQALLDHDKENTNASHRWYPFRNEACFLLWLGRYDPTLTMTRHMLRWILKLLRTLQRNKIIIETYHLPKDPTTIEKWWQYVPTPPKSMFAVSLHK